ncbi:hypothetical protein ACI2KH_06170 [Roseomonas mucosa]|uniref:hypothetical protein n=1 Tax=Roseomonas mucosa TaxID=207340 RepID=UPI00384DA9EA
MADPTPCTVQEGGGRVMLGHAHAAGHPGMALRLIVQNMDVRVVVDASVARRVRLALLGALPAALLISTPFGHLTIQGSPEVAVLSYLDKATDRLCTIRLGFEAVTRLGAWISAHMPEPVHVDTAPRQMGLPSTMAQLAARAFSMPDLTSDALLLFADWAAECSRQMLPSNPVQAGFWTNLAEMARLAAPVHADTPLPAPGKSALPPEALRHAARELAAFGTGRSAPVAVLLREMADAQERAAR